jgi:hypothetical protein
MDLTKRSARLTGLAEEVGVVGPETIAGLEFSCGAEAGFRVAAELRETENKTLASIKKPKTNHNRLIFINFVIDSPYRFRVGPSFRFVMRTIGKVQK